MSELSTFHIQRMDRINNAFTETGDALAAVAARSDAVDQIVSGLFDEIVPADERAGFALLAVGGYGREQLFPHSDVDLLFLFAGESAARASKETVGRLLTAMWDAELRVSQSVRTPQECMRLAPDNSELHISLLDARFLTGDRELYADLSERLLPKFFVRERNSLLRSLSELARSRHKTFSDTIYHLEPDVKEGPGGLRDLQTACWISQLAHMEPGRVPASEDHLADDLAEETAAAKKFLFAVRCYLHYFIGRDKNNLTFDLQETIAHAGSGKAFRKVSGPADWMRDHFRHARTLNRLALRTIDEAGNRQNWLLKIVRDRRSRLSNDEFSVTNGRVYLRRAEALESDPEMTLRLFEFIGRHGLPLSSQAERRLRTLAETLGPRLISRRPWLRLADILKQPRAYEALTAMHETGVLFALLPEIEAIDCLVVRDFYHRYTVDEHSFLAIRILKRLADATDETSTRFAEVFAEVRQPELLFLALLIHDIGKSVDLPRHIARSVEAGERIMERLELADADRETVRFLVEQHLTMANFVNKRDLGDPETLEEFVEIVGTIPRLRALTLMTYADASAVHPGSLTTWRKKVLWQFYMSAYNRLTGAAADRRIHVDPAKLEGLLASADPAEKTSFGRFLEGFPERYLRTHTPAEIKAHFELSKKLETKAAGVSVEQRDALYDVTVVAWDKPALFASLCGVMASAGLSIERAEAFSNAEGLVLDSFRVSVSETRGGTDLDETEIRQLRRTLRRVIQGKEEVSELLARRKTLFAPRGRTPIATEVSFDNNASSRATIFHVISEDRSGLLFDLASRFSQHDYDIEVVLIETQGRKAIDVFYVVGAGAKLTDQQGDSLLKELRGACRSRAA